MHAPSLFLRLKFAYPFQTCTQISGIHKALIHVMTYKLIRQSFSQLYANVKASTCMSTLYKLKHHYLNWKFSLTAKKLEPSARLACVICIKYKAQRHKYCICQYGYNLIRQYIFKKDKKEIVCKVCEHNRYLIVI